LNAYSRRAALRRERLENSIVRPIPQGTKTGFRRNWKKRRDEYDVTVPLPRVIIYVTGSPPPSRRRRNGGTQWGREVKCRNWGKQNERFNLCYCFNVLLAHTQWGFAPFVI
jgi:hypothetical protein